MKLGLKIDLKTLKEYAILCLAYLVICVIFFWPMISNITGTVAGSGGDVFQSMWELWWVPYSIFTLHTTPYLTAFLFYPVGANLATQTMAPLLGMVSAPLQAVGVAFAYNSLFVVSFLLAGVFTYALAHHVTKNRIAAFAAGLIYAFAPIHTVQAFGHLQFVNIAFIPLFVLFFLKMAEERKHRDAILASISFVFLTFFGDIEQALITIFLAFLILVYFTAVKKERAKILNKRYALLFVEMLALVLILGSPAFVSIIRHLNAATLSTVNAQASTAYTELYSPDLLSFFVPSGMNGLTGGIVSSVDASATSERTVYAGYSVIILAAIAIVYDYKEKFAKTGIFLFSLFFLMLISIGPYLQVNGAVTAVPGIYLVYHQIPYLNVLREPGRFDIAIELMLAVLAAMGIVHLHSVVQKKEGAKLLSAVFIFFILIEYNTVATNAGMLNRMYSNATIPTVYKELGLIQGNFTVLELPALPDFSSNAPAFYPGLAMYYQTAFKKPIVGGYTTRYNTTQIFSLMNVPLVTSAYYLQTKNGLVYASPLVENYTNETLLLMKAYNIGFVSVDRRAYNQSELGLLVSYLANLFGYPVYQGNATIVFATQFASSNVLNATVAYTPVALNYPYSLWQPGWLLCGSSVACSQNYSSVWFGINPSYINIYSPVTNQRAKRNATVEMQALSPSGFVSTTAYLNGVSIGVLNLTPSLRNYTLRGRLYPGINQLVFYTRGNATYALGAQNISIVIKN